MLPAPASPFDYKSLPPAVAAELRPVASRIRGEVLRLTSSIIIVGCDLIAVKGKLAHGQFSAWVNAECGFSLRTAENYIRAAEFAEGKSETVSLLPPAAVYKLAAKSTPPALVQEVMERVESGTPARLAHSRAFAARDVRTRNGARDRRERQSGQRRSAAN